MIWAFPLLFVALLGAYGCIDAYRRRDRFEMCVAGVWGLVSLGCAVALVAVEVAL